MRVLIINSVCGIRSTGRICAELAEQFTEQGAEVKIAYGRMDDVPEKYRKYAVRIGTKWDCLSHVLKTRMWDQHGFGSIRATKSFLQWAEKFHPDLVWLHNIHDYYINVELLFKWIKKHPDMEVRWTLHDCWAFTGHCSYFTVVKCEQWKTHCLDCPQLRRYPSCYGKGNVYLNYERKKVAFTGVKHMELIAPSQWLANLVKQSFLKEYPITVRYNTINTDVFKPTPSVFREQHGLQNKFIVLGVASTWDERKGLQDFCQLAQMLNDQYVIVLVGLSKKQLDNLPRQIIGLQGTNDTKELAEIYTAADVFVNPSVEETFGLTSVEALACGTPDIVYVGTACEEIARKDNSGKSRVVPQNVNALYQAVIEMSLNSKEIQEAGENL